MRRFGQIIRVKQGFTERYRRYHSAVWPEVLETIRKCNIQNYSIFLKDNLLYAYFEYTGTDYEGDMEKMAADPSTQKWWAVMKPMQEPVEGRKEGEWWTDMEEVFHLD